MRDVMGDKERADLRGRQANFAIAEMALLRRENETLLAENERLRAFIADKIHDASIERMMMEIGWPR